MNKYSFILHPSCGEPGCANCKGAFVPVLVACNVTDAIKQIAYDVSKGALPLIQRGALIDSQVNDPAFSALSARLADMNRHVHTLPPRSRERSLYAMTIYGAIDDARAKPKYSNPKFAAYERAGARA